MFNNNERDNMNNLKVEVIKKLMMIDTKKELITIRECIADAISRECDNDEKDQKEFAKWKEERGKDEITF
jgi:hypothetical protein